MDERDPGADTAMFRAYVEHGDTADEQAPTNNRTTWIAAAGVAVVVLIVVALLAL